MQISSRFTIAIHIIACTHYFKDDYKITSDFLADSVNVNPVIIRKILQQLKKADIVKVNRGTGGAYIAKDLKDISLKDIYLAVECTKDNELFHFHENPSTNCPVGRNIHNALDDKLSDIQKAFEDKMATITMDQVIKDTKYYIVKEMD